MLANNVFVSPATFSHLILPTRQRLLCGSALSAPFAVGLFLLPLWSTSVEAACSTVKNRLNVPTGFNCTSSDSDGYSLTATGSSLNGTMASGATITNGSTALNLKLGNNIISGGQDLTFAAEDAYNSITSTMADAIKISAPYLKLNLTPSVIGVNYAGSLNASNGNAFSLSSSLGSKASPP